MTDDRQLDTSTLAGARDHARAPVAEVTGTMRTVPSWTAKELPAGVEPASVLWDETVAGGGYVTRILPRGSVVRIADLNGDGCVQLLVFNARDTAERLNPADTVKVQWQAYLRLGALLLSDMGRVLMTIVGDTSGRHDCLCGGTNRLGNTRRHGDGAVSGTTPNTRDLLCVGAAKHGLRAS